MKKRIKITSTDYVKICNLINYSEKYKTEDILNITVLRNEIFMAEKVDPREISPEIVTMNTQVEVIDLSSNASMQLKLVYPNEANFKNGNVSVLSLLGSALLGYGSGCEISFDAPFGKKKMKINKIIYQPEANGEFGI